MKTEPKISSFVSRSATTEAEIQLKKRPEKWGLLFWLGAALALLYFLTAQPIAESDPSSRSAFALTAALATERGPSIDHYIASPSGGFLGSPTDAPNLAYYAGHYYSDSAPGGPLLAVPFYQTGKLFGPDGPGAFGLGLLALLGAATVLAVYGVARRLGSAERSARYAALSLGLSSALWREAGHFGPGVFTLLLLALGLLLALPPLPRLEQSEGGSRLKASRAVLLGLALGFAITVDYPNLAWTPLFVLYLWLSQRAKVQSWLGLAAGWVAGLLPLVLYNWLALGRPWTFSYGFLVDDPAARSFGGQFLSLNLGHLRDIFFGPGRGLLGPFVLFFGAWGLAALYAQRGKRRETILLLALIVTGLLTGLLRRPVGAGSLPVDFSLIMLVPLALGMAVWHERFMFLTRLEQWWLPGLATAGVGLYYGLVAPGPVANWGAVVYLLPLAGIVALVAWLWHFTPRFDSWQKVVGGLGLFILLGLLLSVSSGEIRPAFAESGSNNLLYNGTLKCENGKRAGWYLQGEPLGCSGPLKIQADQKLQPYLIPVQGGKLYQLQLETEGAGQVEWLWAAEPATLDGFIFSNAFSQGYQAGAFKDSRAAPPGAAYLQLVFTPATAASLGNFRLFDDSIRVEPMRNYATAAISFTFDWETAMGGLIHSKGGAPVPGEGEYGGVGLSAENNQAAIADAERRGLEMRRGADYLLELFKRFEVRGTFYANGYNLLDGNRDKQLFADNPTYKWAAPKNGWASDFWLTQPWYGLDPYEDVTTERGKAWYFGDQTNRLREAGQDIQSHTFGHLYVRGTTPEEFLLDTEAFVRYAREKDLPPIRHFAFPWKSSNSVTKDWYQLLAEKGFTSVTRLYDGDQGIIQAGPGQQVLTAQGLKQAQMGQLFFDSGKRDAKKQVIYQEAAGPGSPYFYLGRVKDETRLLVLHDYQLVPGERSEATAKAVVDELIRRRGYGSIWTHPEAIVDPADQGQWLRVVQYAAAQREGGLWVDSVANMIQHRRDMSYVGVKADWSEGGKKARLTITNRAKQPVEGVTLTLPAPLKAAKGAAGFKGAQVLLPTLQVGQSLTIDLEF